MEDVVIGEDMGHNKPSLSSLNEESVVYVCNNNSSNSDTQDTDAGVEASSVSPLVCRTKQNGAGVRCSATNCGRETTTTTNRRGHGRGRGRVAVHGATAGSRLGRGRGQGRGRRRARGRGGGRGRGAGGVGPKADNKKKMSVIGKIFQKLRLSITLMLTLRFMNLLESIVVHMTRHLFWRTFYYFFQ